MLILAKERVCYAYELWFWILFLLNSSVKEWIIILADWILIFDFPCEISEHRFVGCVLEIPFLGCINIPNGTGLS